MAGQDQRLRRLERADRPILTKGGVKGPKSGSVASVACLVNGREQQASRQARGDHFSGFCSNLGNRQLRGNT